MQADLTTALRTLLLEDADLRGDLATADGVYADLVPADAGLPVIRYEVLSDRRFTAVESPSEHRVARVQYDAMALTRREADAIARHVERILSDVPLVIPETRVPESRQVVIDDCVQDNRYARQDPPPAGSASLTYRTVVDFVLSYRHESLDPEA